MSQSTSTGLTLEENVPPGARVRHFDELDEETQQFFLSTANDGTVPPGRGLSQGDIVVFTDYYRVR